MSSFHNMFWSFHDRMTAVKQLLIMQDTDGYEERIMTSRTEFVTDTA
jgi:hypothetical protein